MITIKNNPRWHRTKKNVFGFDDLFEEHFSYLQFKILIFLQNLSFNVNTKYLIFCLKTALNFR